MNEIGLLTACGATILVAALLASWWRCNELQLRLAAAEQAALTDPLTGVANRAGLARELRALAGRARVHVAAVMIDLDGLKSINDRYGHHVGDGVLIEVARRLDEARSRARCVARVGGDEFVVVLEPCTDPLDAEREASTVARALTDRIAAVRIEERVSIAVTASAGTAVVPADRLGELLIAADQAMYRDKNRTTLPGPARTRRRPRTADPAA